MKRGVEHLVKDHGMREEDITPGIKEKVRKLIVSFNEPLLALKSFKPRYYDLVILDIKMPEMNGFELYRQIRRKDNGVKVCFLTALSGLRDYEHYKKEVYPKLHKRHFVAKPISNDELIRRVNEMLTYISAV